MMDSPSLIAAAFEIIPVNPPSFPVHLTVALPRQTGGGSALSIPPAARPERGRLASGRGLAPAQAQASCAGEAAELVSACLWGDERMMLAPYEAVREMALHPASLLLASAEQYRRREAWNAAHGGYDWWPEPFDEGREVEWVEAVSPDGGDRALVAAAQVFIGYSEAGDAAAFTVADSNGCAAGRTREEAVIAGFLELVERDATALWWYGGHVRPAVDPAEADGAAAVTAWLKEHGRGLRLLDLTTDFGIPVRAAVSADGQGDAVAIGVAAHFDPSVAATSALTEMMQTLFSIEVRKAIPSAPDDPFQYWLETVSLRSMPHLVPAAAGRDGAPGHAAVQPTVDGCVALCRNMGLRFLTVDLTRGAVGVPVVRVLVPGLRPLRTRLAAGRLFDVPFKLGWCDTLPTTEHLNLVPLAI